MRALRSAARGAPLTTLVDPPVPQNARAAGQREYRRTQTFLTVKYGGDRSRPGWAPEFCAEAQKLGAAAPYQGAGAPPSNYTKRLMEVGSGRIDPHCVDSLGPRWTSVTPSWQPRWMLASPGTRFVPRHPPCTAWRPASRLRAALLGGNHSRATSVFRSASPEHPSQERRRCPRRRRKLWVKPVVRPIRFHDLRHGDPKITTELHGHLAPEGLRGGPRPGNRLHRESVYVQGRASSSGPAKTRSSSRILLDPCVRQGKPGGGGS